MLFDTLQNFAEVGIAVAGFSGIAAALDSKSGETWADAKVVGLRLLLETAGLVVFFAFVPQVLDRASLPDSTIWRVAAGAYALAHLAHGRTVMRRMKQSRRRPEPSPPSWALYVGMLVILAQGVSVVLASTEHVQLVYLCALGWHTFVAALSFAMLLFASVEDGPE